MKSRAEPWSHSVRWVSGIRWKRSCPVPVLSFILLVQKAVIHPRGTGGWWFHWSGQDDHTSSKLHSGRGFSAGCVGGRFAPLESTACSWTRAGPSQEVQSLRTLRLEAASWRRWEDEIRIRKTGHLRGVLTQGPRSHCTYGIIKGTQIRKKGFQITNCCVSRWSMMYKERESYLV